MRSTSALLATQRVDRRLVFLRWKRSTTRRMSGDCCGTQCMLSEARRRQLQFARISLNPPIIAPSKRPELSKDSSQRVLTIAYLYSHHVNVQKPLRHAYRLSSASGTTPKPVAESRKASAPVLMTKPSIKRSPSWSRSQ